MTRRSVAVIAGLLLALGSYGACSGESAAPTAETPAKKGKAKKGKKVKGKAKKVEKAARRGPAPSLLMVQAQFGRENGKPKPLPAKLVVMRHLDGEYWPETIEDPDSNVFHKAIAWRDGILTIGAQKAMLKHWKIKDGEWQGAILWQKSWGGKFDRLRDLEIGDVTGDGKENLVLATHDMGVVAVGSENADGGWSFLETPIEADTFVHEIEIGDVDGDGTKEFYATPSERNKASGESQPGAVVRYDWEGDALVKSDVVRFTESHAKEILVTDIDGDGTDELYVVREGHTVKENGKTTLKDPVRIVQMTPKEGGGWTETVVATLDDPQCRFLLPGDVDGDGDVELIAAGFKSGLWLLERNADGTFANTLIDADSGGFEHATHVADLDGDGKFEIYVAADTQKEIRRYSWNGTSFSRHFVDDIGPADISHITWNIQDGVF